MTKSELIARLAARNPHLYQRDIERIIATVFDEIADALARGRAAGRDFHVLHDMGHGDFHHGK